MFVHIALSVRGRKKTHTSNGHFLSTIKIEKDVSCFNILMGAEEK